MKYGKLMVIGIIAFITSGCGVFVTVTQPIGEEPHKVNAEDWEGTWISSEGLFTIGVLDAEKGILEMASILSNATLKLESHKLYLRDSGDWIFWNTKNKDSFSSEEGHYFWGRIEKEERQIIFWMPDPSKFEDLVKEGKLPGEIYDSLVITLGNLEPEHLEVITSGDNGVLFLWDMPFVLIKITE